MAQFDAAAYWEDRLSKHYDLQGVGYTSLGRSYNKWLYRVRKTVFHREVSRLPIDFGTATILDIGSGTGFYIDLWEKLGVSDLEGSDITQIAIEGLERRFRNHRFHLLDVGAERAEVSRKYSIISAFDVLFHIVDDDRFRRALRNIHLWLEPEGWFILSDDFVHGNRVTAAHHVVRPLSEIEAMLNQEGFVIVRRRPMFFLMNQPHDTNSSLFRFLWKACTFPVKKFESIGFLVGAALFPLELVLTRLFSEGPATEIMICRRGARPGATNRE